MAEMLERSASRPRNAGGSTTVSSSSEAARLQRLVETLLNFGRMEAGAAQYRFADVDAAALVRSVVQEIEPQAREPGRQIEFSGPDAEIRLRADENALALALRNLIDNAIKYSPDEPTVRVEWRHERSRGDFASIDRGVGIPRG